MHRRHRGQQSEAEHPGRQAILERIDRYRRRVAWHGRQRLLYLAGGGYLLAWAAAARLASNAGLSAPRLTVLGAGVALAFLVALARRPPTRAESAAELDRRLALQDRLKTVVGMSQPSALAPYLLHDTRARLSREAVRAILPPVVPRQAWLALGATVLAALVLEVGRQPRRAPNAVAVHGVPAPVPAGRQPAEAGRGDRPPAREPLRRRAPRTAPRKTSSVPARPEAHLTRARPVARLPKVVRKRARPRGAFSPLAPPPSGGRAGGAGDRTGHGGIVMAEPRELFAPRPEKVPSPLGSFPLELGAGAARANKRKPGTALAARSALRGAGRRQPDLSLRRRQAVDEAVRRMRVPAEYEEVIRRLFAK